jgi:hypothetical protein
VFIVADALAQEVRDASWVVNALARPAMNEPPEPETTPAASTA